ncbi:MAG: helix-turn-helix transcriptional regulator [Thermoanaerobacterium sp.]|nr:helix-turn-helix transcriptional regulator [Thermoanaerobacterium sp.]
MKINERIKQIRLKKGIKQSYIARKLGKTAGWYCNIENGRRELKAEDAKKNSRNIGNRCKFTFF